MPVRKKVEHTQVPGTSPNRRLQTPSARSDRAQSPTAHSPPRSSPTVQHSSRSHSYRAPIPPLRRWDTKPDRIPAPRAMNRNHPNPNSPGHLAKRSATTWNALPSDPGPQPNDPNRRDPEPAPH